MRLLREAKSRGLRVTRRGDAAPPHASRTKRCSATTPRARSTRRCASAEDREALRAGAQGRHHRLHRDRSRAAQRPRKGLRVRGRVARHDRARAGGAAAARPGARRAALAAAADRGALDRAGARGRHRGRHARGRRARRHRGDRPRARLDARRVFAMLPLHEHAAACAHGARSRRADLVGGDVVYESHESAYEHAP